MHAKLHRPKVLVLLSTHNGSRWLSEFLASLISQSDVNLSLIVRDDGSSDNSVKILRSFCKKLDMEILTGENIGTLESYLILIRLASEKDFDYFSLADQDDIWHNKKTISAISRLQTSRRQVYGSRRIPFSEDGSLRRNTFPRKDVKTSFTLSLFENFLPACTIVGTKDFLLWLCEIPIPSSLLYIDAAICTLACSSNSLYMDQNSYIDYRVHPHNTVGISKGFSKIRNFRKDTFGQKTASLIWYANNEYKQISDNDALLARRILFERGIIKRFEILLICGDMRQSKLESFALKFFLILRVPG